MGPKIVCIVGKKKSGKTTLLEGLIPAFKELGLRVGTVKHDAHSFEMDREGKDSWRHRQAGADSVLVSSPTQVALIKRVDREAGLAELVLKYFADCQIVLAEGYFRSDLPKVEVHRCEAHSDPLCTVENAAEKKLLALVSDQKRDLGVPFFGLDQAGDVVRFLAHQLLEF
ncbi:MAG: molybdopterin-guanine dinucleotide biosynthesis protein B [Desulfovibrio sp.]